MIPFNKPYMTGRELWHIAQAHANGHLSGDGQFTKRCHAWLEQNTGANRALLTHSCTSALEMSALLLDLQEGDEVIMPSYTFVSTANAFALRGAVPVFVDIRADTLNLDERLVEAAITPRTKAICVVHYAGVACEMDTIMEIAARHGLVVVEDAAQAIMSTYKGRPLGAIGEMGALSFHETKNIISGEGGALLCRDSQYAERAEIIREKGTNRSRFFRGQVDKYTWVDRGSSFLPGEITAAFLMAQMDEAEQINQRRLAIWERYNTWARQHADQGKVRLPTIPEQCHHNAHMYYLLLPSLQARTAFIANMKASGVQTVFHYIPLHSAPAGQALGRPHGAMTVTDTVSDCLVRLPLWIGVEDHLDTIFAAADKALS
ncbi:MULTISPECIES: dTDP-4-amino-4,6-dideoxygalactose transaminase [Stenotrophomonas]|uniref:dTDP-4-amino-4,6-dideoxygalactose transaminase n=2 Tax=Stenotrophomonas lactitubi TaxID=2045214 RepID=A0AAW4GLL2_9GAMM|nr:MULTISPECIES: dTDP-4-amino-4,6-dideoxygalactose transaminase [Stenotrophomonas]MBM9915597.1 dTDP-4-amino-4,6-dideoxygalactose transaminase [Stenotrophomonas lactitubi]MBM9922713.1 dTDP-4-amino-4,6-dideoxygalactose transaminase [Stenotrophomonas lactitubi]MBM9939343.1 dTDP-4-amino-4,6-dideoxygalactose transaminase [Stenotrophomonas lactitubi]